MKRILIIVISTCLFCLWGCVFFIEVAGYKEDYFPSADISNGFYSDPFTVTLTAPLSDMSVCYTLDCSDPLTSPTAVTGNPPVQVLIDPDSTAGGRMVTPGVILRVAGKSPAAGNTFPRTYTYIFLNRLADLSPDEISPGGDWPAQEPGTGWPDYDVQKMDYGIDPDVAGSMTQTRIDTIMRAIPSIYRPERP
jgi:hypothetical protein